MRAAVGRHTPPPWTNRRLEERGARSQNAIGQVGVSEEMRDEAQRLVDGYFAVRVPKRAPYNPDADPYEEVGLLRSAAFGIQKNVQEKKWREAIGVVERATASNRALVTARRAEWAAPALDACRCIARPAAHAEDGSGQPPCVAHARPTP